MIEDRTLRNIKSNATDPKLIATVQYTSLPSSGTFTVYCDNVLSRNAWARTIISYNTMDQALNTLKAVMYDSTIVNLATHRTTGGGLSQATLTPTANNFGIAVDTSENNVNNTYNLGQLAAHVDSIAFTLTMGATAPTSGSVSIYVVEMI